MVADLATYLGLFSMAFGAASLLPMASEPLLVGLQLAGYPLITLWLVATCGNTLGSVLNWWLAHYGLRYRQRPWFPVSEAQLNRATVWFQRYGLWSLLLAWTPILGDALTVAAGLFRVKLGVFLVLVGLSKGSRYAALMWLTGLSL